jgi:hypothetical protein
MWQGPTRGNNSPEFYTPERLLETRFVEHLHTTQDAGLTSCKPGAS